MNNTQPVCMCVYSMYSEEGVVVGEVLPPNFPKYGVSLLGLSFFSSAHASSSDTHRVYVAAVVFSTRSFQAHSSSIFPKPMVRDLPTKACKLVHSRHLIAQSDVMPISADTLLSILWTDTEVIFSL